jgi:integration host factor subunit alpha
MAELIEMLCDRAGLNRQEAKEIVKAFSFGNFQLRDKSQRPGRNPKTGEATIIAARRIVTFHASQKLKVRLEIGREQRRRD